MRRSKVEMRPRRAACIYRPHQPRLQDNGEDGGKEQLARLTMQRIDDCSLACPFQVEYNDRAVVRAEISSIYRRNSSIARVLPGLDNEASSGASRAQSQPISPDLS